MTSVTNTSCPNIPASDTITVRIKMGLEKITEEGESCCLCHWTTIDESLLGPLFKLKDIIVHQYCLLFSYSVEQNGTDKEGILGFLPRDIKRGLTKVKPNICVYCCERNASVKCAKKKCENIFHFPCGVENGSLNQFKGRFDSYCSEHRPKQRVPSAIVKRAQKERPTCLICLDDVEVEHQTMVLWASCCRHTWYHRNCLQKYALSAGRFLIKCVACRDTTRFKRLIETYGIYVPRQDASWETVPHAYQELYTVYSRCDASECLCPDGREFSEDTGSWNVMVCSVCGSQGIHERCNSSDVESWTCGACLSVVAARPAEEEPRAEETE